MRFILIILTVAVAVQGSFELPFLGNKLRMPKIGGDITKELQRHAEGFVNFVNETGRKVVGEVKKHTQGVVDTLKEGKLLSPLSLQNAGNDFFKNAGGLLSETDNFMNELTTLQTKALNATNELLTKTENDMQNIMSDVNQKVNDMMNKTAGDLMAHMTNMAQWEKDVLKPYKGLPQYAAAETIAQDFVSNATNYINSCISNVLDPMKQLQGNVNETAVEVMRQARNAVMLAGNCTMFRTQALEHMLNCLKGIPNQIFDANVFITMRILPIREKLMYYSINQIAYSSCIVAMSTFINIGKGLKEQQIRWLK